MSEIAHVKVCDHFMGDANRNPICKQLIGKDKSEGGKERGAERHCIATRQKVLIVSLGHAMVVGKSNGTKFKPPNTSGISSN